MENGQSGHPQLTSKSVRLQEELRVSKDELKKLQSEITKLQIRKREVEEKISSLKSEMKLANDSEGASPQFHYDNFSWSLEMTNKLRNVFNIQEFRSHQKAAINATMSKLDCILIMPTGGGKSLCFQLPAVLSDGVTIVVSPLISLMEDQLQGLQALNIKTVIFNSNTTREETKQIYDSMIDTKSPLKMLYCTPEKMAKSKRLMSQLEKIYRVNRFARLVIDEVHCCSQWGHDFRPDYKFLGIMKTQFPTVPIIGLTATATSSVVVDVQKILNIEGCLVFKDSFFRPNLKYEVQEITTKDKVEDIANMINSRFSKQSGIIYCLTISDTEQVTKKLVALDIRAQCYHAQLLPEARTLIQKKWYSNHYQVIVATVAFGMGINKLDVRFVIHHSMSKSIENYYQETGRAGRDGNIAHCILFYHFQDSFRASSLMFTEKTGLQNVYNMLRYSLDNRNCRKALIAQHFGDQWDENCCKNMCDNCEIEDRVFLPINATSYLEDIIKLLDNAENLEERMTPLKLMDVWFGKGVKKLRLDSIKVPRQSREICEHIFIELLSDGYLKEEFHFTPYSTISYIVPGPTVHLRQSGSQIVYQFPSRTGKSNKDSRVGKEKGKNVSKRKSATTSERQEKEKSTSSRNTKSQDDNPKSSSSSKRKRIRVIDDESSDSEKNVQLREEILLSD